MKSFGEGPGAFFVAIPGNSATESHATGESEAG